MPSRWKIWEQASSLLRVCYEQVKINTVQQKLRDLRDYCSFPASGLTMFEHSANVPASAVIVAQGSKFYFLQVVLVGSSSSPVIP